MIPTLPPLVDVLDLMLDAVCVVDADGRFLFVNASFQRIFGYTADEVLGQPIFELVYPDDRAATSEQAEAVMAGKLQRHFRNRYVHKDGHNVDIQWSARWLPEHAVRIGVGREVTELRRLESELELKGIVFPEVREITSIFEAVVEELEDVLFWRRDVPPENKRNCEKDDGGLRQNG